MARNPRDKTPSTKQEPGFDQEDGKAPAAAATAAARARASSRAWPGLKDPRIVRVSRAFGGKDRHSKVSTVRGLRDRRVRLSVQTAIQLYDLQDRLGLSQPSKVVDWLLDAAQHEIDKLPQLQIPPGSCFLQFPPPAAAVASHAVPLGLPQASRPSAVAASDVNQMEDSGAGSLGLLPGRDGNYDRGDVEHQGPALPRNNLQHHAAEVIPIHGNLHRLGFLSMLSGGSGGGSNATYGSYCLLETPSVFAQSTQQLGGYSMTQAAEETHGYRPVVPPTPSLSLSHASQLLLCPSGAAAPSMFSPYAAASADYEPKHGDSSNSTVFQLLGNSSASSQSSKHHQFWNGQESG
ncbi:hypothetical protein Taro_039968 [Colocasia esculenta]|uniref:TCP domain-containing protein n=1 Tax=Colocasia esculenta TaxID=4460 RepID=A0A843WNT9_COLES|nr:hypothetical protein [Colocasia esculenta]